MSDSVVIVIQPRVDDVKNELHVEEYTKQALSASPSNSDVAVQYATVSEKTTKHEQGLLIPLGILTEVAGRDAKPELQCNIKQANITSIIHIKPDVQNDHVSSICQNKGDSEGDLLADNNINIKHLVEDNSEQTDSNVAVESLVQLEEMIKDDQSLLMPLGISKEVTVLDVKPELQCNIKQENISNIRDSLDVKPAVQPDLVQKCHLDDDSSGYLSSNTLIVKQECSEAVTEDPAALEESWIKHKVNPSIDKCEQIETICRNSAQRLDKSAADCINDNITGEVSVKNEQFTDNNKITKHIRAHTGEIPFSCLHCDKRFTEKSNLTKHIRTHTGEKPFSCHLCHKPCIDKSDLTKHIRIHTGEKPFSCPYCDKRFSDKSSLPKHVRTHTGEKPFSCLHCDKPFSDKGDLTRHIRIHTGEKPFSCLHCDKRFNDKSDLRRHIRSHTGEKPFSCPYCDKQFSDRSTLAQHIRRHTGEKEFTCDHCDKRFSRKCFLTTHVRRHTGEKPFSCHHCEKRFSQKSDLTKHIRIHTGEKPFTCHHCDKGFRQKSDLIKHVRIHTGEKPFSCIQCDKRFSAKYSLTRHIMTHTG